MPTPLLWSIPLRDPLMGLTFAQEAMRLLVRGITSVRLLSVRGEVQVQTRFESAVHFAEISQDGRRVVTVTEDGTIRVLDGELKPLWKLVADERVCSLAVDPLGRVVAVAEAKSTVTLFTDRGEKWARIPTPRPVVRLQFLARSGYLLCVGDLGWLAAYDLARKEWAWRGTLFFNTAYLAVPACEEPILVGGFSDAMAAFSAEGKRFEWHFALPPAREVAFTHDGRKLFCLSREGLLRGYSIQGHELSDFPVRTGISHLATDGLGKRLYLGTTSGHLEAVQSLAISSRRVER